MNIFFCIQLQHAIFHKCGRCAGEPYGGSAPEGGAVRASTAASAWRPGRPVARLGRRDVSRGDRGRRAGRSAAPHFHPRWRGCRGRSGAEFAGESPEAAALAHCAGQSPTADVPPLAGVPTGGSSNVEEEEVRAAGGLWAGTYVLSKRRVRFLTRSRRRNHGRAPADPS